MPVVPIAVRPLVESLLSNNPTKFGPQQLLKYPIIRGGFFVATLTVCSTNRQNRHFKGGSWLPSNLVSKVVQEARWFKKRKKEASDGPTTSWPLRRRVGAHKTKFLSVRTSRANRCPRTRASGPAIMQFRCQPYTSFGSHPLKGAQRTLFLKKNMALTSEKLQCRRMGFGLNSISEVLRMQHSWNFVLHDDAFTPHLGRIEFGSNRRCVAPRIKFCKSPRKRSIIPVADPSRESFSLRWRCIAGLMGLDAFALRLPDPYTFVVRKFGITWIGENPAVELFRKCHGSQRTALGQCLWRLDLANG